MSAPLTVSSRIRDISFSDSCNCCERRSTLTRHISADSAVYIKDNGKVVAFDPKSTDAAAALIRSYKRLDIYINLQMVNGHKDVGLVHKSLADNYSIDLASDMENAVPLTMERVVKVKDVVQRVLFEKS